MTCGHCIVASTETSAVYFQLCCPSVFQKQQLDPARDQPKIKTTITATAEEAQGKKKHLMHAMKKTLQQDENIASPLASSVIKQDACLINLLLCSFYLTNHLHTGAIRLMCSSTLRLPV